MLWAVHETQVMLLFILHIYTDKLSSIRDWPQRGARVALAGRTFDVLGGHGPWHGSVHLPQVEPSAYLRPRFSRQHDADFRSQLDGRLCARRDPLVEAR